MRRIIYLFALVVLLISTGCATYARGPWRGQVLDADTKEPVEGAVVVAVIEVNYGIVLESRSEYLDSREVLTNSEGRFEIERIRQFTLLPNSEIIGPRFLIYKPGYGPFPGYQTYPEKYKLPYYFETEGAVVMMPKSMDKKVRRMWMGSADILDLTVPESKLELLNNEILTEKRWLGILPK